MTIYVRPGGDGSRRRAPLYAGLGLALGLGFAAASGHGVAWADSDGAGARGGSVSHSDPGTDTGDPAGHGWAPARSAPSDPAKPNSAAGSARTHWGGRSSTDGSQKAKATTTVPETPEDTSGQGTDSESSEAAAKPSLAATPSTAPLMSTAAAHKPVVVEAPGRGAHRAAAASSGHAASPPASLHTSEPALPVRSMRGHTPPSESPIATHTAAAAAIATPAADTLVSPAAKTAAVTTTPRTPTPLSPIARLLAVPAHIVNQRLGLIGVTTAAGTPASPVMPDPVVDLVYAAFRRLENIAGLDSPPAAQPVPIGQTFTGSPTTHSDGGAVPERIHRGYVLGGVPGGLTPFTTADGLQMTSTNILTGEAAKVWVTPQKQIIIAYQGTTGGTNLLFNPLIVVSQFFTDLQGIFTNTTPAAFHDSLRFAGQVQVRRKPRSRAMTRRASL